MAKLTFAWVPASSITPRDPAPLDADGPYSLLTPRKPGFLEGRRQQERIQKRLAKEAKKRGR